MNAIELVKTLDMPREQWLELRRHCVLLWQMGYRTEVNDGHFIKVVQEAKRKKQRLKAAITPASLYH